ncbi:MAG: hypothetical protein GXP56_02450 [Deltaproteobacteria bacterium]|nr:hypothetical protein [Deltaproteobacteria bacterium]
MERVPGNQNEDKLRDYYSAEFKLNQPRILYRFRIRKSITEPMFAVVKEGSKALENIKEGDIINMRYYCLDKSIPAESKDTKIKYITKDNSTGFKDHYVIGLSLNCGEDFKVA